LFLPGSSFAQAYPFPTHFGFGFSVLKDQRLPAVDGSLVFDFSLANWLDKDGDSRIDDGWELVLLRGELGPSSDVQPCQSGDPSSEVSADCVDKALFGGVRYRFGRHLNRRPWPFAGVLLGGYWRGSGEDDVPSSTHFALDVGGGIEMRWRDSIQGFRISTNYRRVFGADRNQIQIQVLYFLAPRVGP
jgi:hypothetical protein